MTEERKRRGWEEELLPKKNYKKKLNKSSVSVLVLRGFVMGNLPTVEDEMF